MEIEGVVINILPPVTGTSGRGDWKKQEVIIEQPGEYGRKVCISFWGDKAGDAANLKEGERVSVAVNVESREYNGRWYTELRAWKMSKGAATGQGGAVATPSGGGGGGRYSHSAPMPSEEPQAGSSEQDYDDLPF